MNPFKIGKEYSREHFIDREKELAYVKQVTDSGNNLALLAPRRFGKTWLLRRFAEETYHVVVYVDLFGVISLKGFAMQIIDRSFKILKAKDPVAFIGRYLKNSRGTFRSQSRSKTSPSASHRRWTMKRC